MTAVSNLRRELDEEAQLLMEAGAYEPISFDLLDFEMLIPDLLLKEDARKQEMAVGLLFILTLLVVLLITGRISPLSL